MACTASERVSADRKLTMAMTRVARAATTNPAISARGMAKRVAAWGSKIGACDAGP